MDLTLAKEAVKYYMDTTGETYDDFYSNLDTALDTQPSDYNVWLVKVLMGEVLKTLSLDDFKANKDAIRGTVDSESRKKEGEFYTPLRWCAEARTYFDKHIPDWKNYNVWDGSSGTGNLMRTADHDGRRLFLSTLRHEDVENVQATFPDATVFQLDFLNKLDYDLANLEFIESLPERLQNIIKNDEPLIIFMNPPYKAGSARGTDIGRYMCEIGLGRAATDIFYQFLFRVQDIVERFNLTNTWFGFFGPLTYFTGASAGTLLKEFEYRFRFIDGMCLSAQEFSDTSESIEWGIGFSLWKSLGGYNPAGGHKDIILERKYTNDKGEIVCEGKELYAPPREKLSDWVKPKDVVAYTQAPLMTSYLTFKDGQGEKDAPRSGRLARNALGTLMTGNTLARNAGQSAILSMPTTIQYVDITKENFWRCVSSYVYRRVVEVGWAKTKKELSAPVTTVEGYQEWLMNALVYFLFEWKSMMSSIRGVQFSGEIYTVRNHLFYCSAEEIKGVCTDDLILQDIEKHPPVNEFMIEQIASARPYWVKECADLFDFCKGYTLESINDRRLKNYANGCDAWDAGIQQIRGCIWSDDLESELSSKIASAREWLRKDIGRFGFIDSE